MIKPRPIKWPEPTIQIIMALRALGYGVESFLRMAMQPCQSMVKMCMWFGRSVPCDEIFVTTKSEKGFCCAFNSIYAMKLNKYVS